MAERTPGPDRRRPGEPAPRRLLDRLLDPLRWDDIHQRLAAQPVFRECTRNEIRQLARAGDECLVPAGTVVCREDRIGYWFFVVIDGTVRLSRKDQPCATLGPGSHLGDVAILGFGPQPVTATAVVDATVFVLGRRHVLDLSYAMPTLQRGLFPDVAPGRFQAKVRELRAAGQAEWRRVPRGRAALAAGRGELLPAALRIFPARGSTAAGPAFPTLLARRDRTADVLQGNAGRQPLSRRLVTAVAGMVVALAVVFGLTFHPGMLVVRPSASLDVTDDVEVEGIPVHRPAGRYILTAVSIEEPNLLGAAQAMLVGDETLPAPHGDALAEDRRIGREEYLDSQRRAVRLVAARAGVDPDGVTVRFRDRHLSGPSAGLLYALLLADMAGQVDVGKGRVVAATGVLGEDGRVLPVGFVKVKRRVAERAHAEVFLVPVWPKATPAPGRMVVPVATFDDAVRVVGASRRS